MLVINTLIASLFVHKMTVLPSIPEDIIQQVETVIQQFIWNGTKPKISLAALKIAKQSGGLGLVDLRKKDDALKVAWI